MLRTFILCLPLLAASPAALADNAFCGGAQKPASPDDLDNAVGELSLQYVAAQPAGPVSCAAGYLLSKCGDHETANKVFDKCIAAGYTGALIWKALMYENGLGVPKDATRAADMLHRAATSGDPYYGPLGKMHYATALLQGRGVERDVDAAMRWFREAAAEGDETAQEFLRTGRHTAVRDETGRGVGDGPGDGSSVPVSASDSALQLAASELALELASETAGVPPHVRPSVSARRLGGGEPAGRPLTAARAETDAATEVVTAQTPASPTGRHLIEQPSALAQPAGTPADPLWLLPMLAAFVVGALARLRSQPAAAVPGPAAALGRPLLRRVA